ESVAHTLVDNVSKNGNLLLNIPLPGNGEPDADELKFLTDFTAWMDINSSGIYATRPWKIFGEGPATKSNFTAKDFRFMQKDGVLYAFGMGWPDDGKFTITSLAEGSPQAPGKIERVEMLGMTEPLKFTRDATGLVITVPEQKVGNYAYGLKISGSGLTV
ncbi:MAG TPA: alpha-L-fucosidase C-terminal domain-containing protein, partial [Opitutales bacterium]|nr:alpha-L-fucosidase C-terminal domain-containing protein [Opitutales bacterium]